MKTFVPWRRMDRAEARNERILFLIGSLGRGGAERQLCLLASRLHAGGWKVKVVTFYPGGELRPELEKAGVPVLSLQKRGRWDVLPFLVRLARLLGKERPGILHTYLTTANVVGVLAKPWLRGGRLIWGIRTSNADLSLHDRLTRLTARTEERLARFADCIIVNSEAGRRDHAARGFPEHKMAVIANGIDTKRFRYDPEGRRRVRGEWGVADDRIVVGLAARLDPEKDHATFLRAAARIARRLPDCRFVCVGSGPADYARRLRAFARVMQLERVLTWVDGREDMPAVHSAFDIACSSSSGEGSSNAVAEAMACERACIATDVGDSQRIVADTGRVVAPGSAAALAEAIESLAARGAEERAELGRRARRRIETAFPAEALVANTVDVLRRVAFTVTHARRVASAGTWLEQYKQDR